MSEEILPREILDKVISWMNRPEVIAIKGSRQAGKTTLLRMIEDKLMEKGISSENIFHFSFEDRDNLDQFEEDPVTFIESLSKDEDKIFVLLDEYQYVQGGGQKLKLIFDKFKDKVKFIITGSSSLELEDTTAEYMVGRMFSINLHPFSFKETLFKEEGRLLNIWEKRNNKVKRLLSGEEDLNLDKLRDNSYEKQFKKLWENYCLYGGYPAVVMEDDKRLKEDILTQLMQTYINRDITKLLEREDIKKFRNMTKMLAAQTGQLLNYNQLADDTDTYFKKVKHFLSVLEETYLIKRLYPYHKNVTTELKKNPKLYVLDIGLRNSLLSNFGEIQFRADQGQVIETASLANIIYSFSDTTEISFWRTTGGSEVDFIVQKGENIFPIEVKYKQMKNKNVSKSTVSFIKNYSPKAMFILTDSSWGRRKIEETRVWFIPVWYFGSAFNFWN